jgi:hypothetical protein
VTGKTPFEFQLELNSTLHNKPVYQGTLWSEGYPTKDSYLKVEEIYIPTDVNSHHKNSRNMKKECHGLLQKFRTLVTDSKDIEVNEML